MTFKSEATPDNKQRDNDFFTSTIVGLPSEITLGKTYANRKPSQQPNVTIDAISAAVWHSDAARTILLQQIKQSPKTLGLPFPAGSFARTQSNKSSYLAFLLGFVLCAALSFAYITQPWLQNLLRF
jgi:hypothetical protein